jgi:triacylglycerol lipase
MNIRVVSHSILGLVTMTLAGACTVERPASDGDEATSAGHPAEPPTPGDGPGTGASSAGDPGVDPDPEPEAPPKTVLLIPGTTITGDYFDEMVERLSADGFNPIVFEPPDLFTESLRTGAQRISDEVQRVLQESGEGRLHIVAECNGGVATRYYLELLGGHAFVDQVVTFVSAHNGTWLSPVGAWVTGWQALEDIKPGSPFMEDLNGKALPAGLKLTSIYTCNDEFMFPYDTSAVAGARNVLFCDQYLGHFDGFWDAVVYEHIRGTLRGQGDALPAAY